MSDVTYPLFPIFTFLGIVLPLLPLRWHLQSLNSGTCYFIFWSSLACLNQFVNSIVWANHARNVAPAWCEISIRIMMAASVGLPAASLCINRRLYLITTVRTASITLSEKHRAVIIDSIICLLFPLFYVALQYIVQGHRFNIFEEIGCYPALYNTLLSFFVSSMWPLLIGLTSMIYCFLSLRSFASRRLEFGYFLSSSTTLTLNRYFRLMGLAMAEICSTTPLAIFTIWLNATATPIGPWRSWADTHFNYSRIEQFPAVIWRQNHLLVIALEFSRWITPLCSFIFFGFFGFSTESRKNYGIAWNWAANKLNLTSPPLRKPSKPERFNLSLGKKDSSTTTTVLPSAHDLELKRCGTLDSSLSVMTGDLTCFDCSPSTTHTFSEAIHDQSLLQGLSDVQKLQGRSDIPKVALTRSRTL